MAVTAVVALLVVVAHAFVGWRLLPELSHPRIDRSAIKPMLRYGMSMALIMVVGIALMNAEKFLVAALGSAGALAFYSVAFTLARLLAVMPGAFGQVLLPAFAQLQVAADRRPLQLLYARSVRALLLVNLPLAAFLAFSARPFVTLWAGPQYGAASTTALSILAVGCLIDGLSYVPRVMLEAVGRPDLIARFLMLTIGPYLVTAVALIHWWGIAGAAAAWAARAVVECALMFGAAHRAAGFSRQATPGQRMPYAAALLTLLVPAAAAPWIGSSLAATLAVVIVSTAGYAAITWLRVLTQEERGWALRYSGRLLRTATST